MRLLLATTRQPEVYLFFVALDIFTFDFVVQEQSVQNPGADFGNVFFFKLPSPFRPCGSRRGPLTANALHVSARVKVGDPD